MKAYCIHHWPWFAACPHCEHARKKAERYNTPEDPKVTMVKGLLARAIDAHFEIKPCGLNHDGPCNVACGY